MKNITLKNLKKHSTTLVKYGQPSNGKVGDTTGGTDPTTSITSGVTTVSGMHILQGPVK